MLLVVKKMQAFGYQNVKLSLHCICSRSLRSNCTISLLAFTDIYQWSIACYLLYASGVPVGKIKNVFGSCDLLLNFILLKHVFFFMLHLLKGSVLMEGFERQSPCVWYKEYFKCYKINYHDIPSIFSKSQICINI